MVESLYDEALDKPEQVQEEQTEEPLDEQTASLLYRGHLTTTSYIDSHEIRIRTLKIGEELDATLVADPWKDSLDASRAMITAIVAACVISVDGEPLVGSLGPKDESIPAKFDYIRKNWHWISVKKVYDDYNTLVLQVFEKYELLKKD